MTLEELGYESRGRKISYVNGKKHIDFYKGKVLLYCADESEIIGLSQQEIEAIQQEFNKLKQG